MVLKSEAHVCQKRIQGSCGTDFDVTPPPLPPSAAPNQLIAAMTGLRKGDKLRCYKFALVGARMMLVSFGFASCKPAAWCCSLELPKAGPFTALRALPAVSLVLPSKTELIRDPRPHRASGPNCPQHRWGMADLMDGVHL